nr:regulation of nuclear pre-mRNA domain-containing protein 1B-like [Ipomoea batatas]
MISHQQPLVDIWEERKVFGSRGQLLKDEVLGKNPSLPVSNGKNPNPIKVIKRDAHSLRIKLAVGDLPEKIITAFQVVHDENTNEKAALNKCKDALSHFKEMEKDIANISSHGTPQGSEMVDKIQEQENVLQQCVTQLENSEASRVALISQLMEAVQDETLAFQESKLELIRNDMKAAHKQIEQAANMRKRLTSPFLPIEAAARAAEPIPPSAQLTSVVPLPTIPVTSFASSKPTDEESKRAAAAAVAAKLAASTSSAQMLTSVLSSLVAEEAAASMSSGLKRGFSSNLAYGSPEKRPKLDNPGTFSDMNKADGGGSAYFSTGMQSLPQTNPMPAAFPPPPPPPPIPPANSPPSQLVQSAAMMMGVLPYGGGFYPPPGFGFYGQSPQTTPPPVPRQ